ncbi:MAG: hemolysin family protein [Fusobacterium perfoetens]|uniref:hemolysin family protein n=1 Tax=Fusobacterium perfoetens TaxID=852 RepID=UPI0023F194E8|nr:hemolysin family protein [Fusobacterium perfoetens]MCI6152049.1 hemolysin family protein [Fusobacterium perfoetens]MDY3238060.1 hemolysin family protein [Fusobacterium perfoetens]
MEVPTSGQMISNLLFLVFLTLVNAFFACTEMAMVSVNKNKINMIAEKGDKRAKLILKLLEEPTNFLSTIQVAITLSGFFASASAATNFSYIVANWLMLFNIPYSKEIALILVTIILSFFTLVFGELVPKRVALQKAETMSLFAVRIVYLISKIVLPFIKLLSFSTNFILKVLGMNLKNMEERVSEEEIKSLIEIGEKHGVFNETEKEMITSVLSFDDKCAREVMTPRKNVYCIDINKPLSEYIDELLETRHSRVPIYEEDKDNIIGILYIKDFIIEARLKGFENVNIRDIMQKPYFILENKNIDVLFKEFQEKKIFIALLIDEYGGFSGIVTMEDLIEEIMGSIEEVHDEAEPKLEKIDEDNYIVDGLYSMDDLNYELDLKFDNEEFDTVSGFVINLLGKIPEENEKLSIDYKNISFEILGVKEKCIDKIKITIHHIEKSQDDNIEEDDE